MTDAIADRLAIIDLVNGYVDMLDAKRWDLFDSFFTADAVAWMNPQRRLDGRDAIHAFTSGMLGDAEIVTYHHAASFTPVIRGDTAHAAVRIRAMHSGVGARKGRFWESLAVQESSFVRTPDRWRFSGFEWRVVVGLGSLGLFDGLWPKS
jgi:hypothetical protein